MFKVGYVYTDRERTSDYWVEYKVLKILPGNRAEVFIRASGDASSKDYNVGKEDIFYWTGCDNDKIIKESKVIEFLKTHDRETKA